MTREFLREKGFCALLVYTKTVTAQITYARAYVVRYSNRKNISSTIKQ